MWVDGGWRSGGRKKEEEGEGESGGKDGEEGYGGDGERGGEADDDVDSEGHGDGGRGMYCALVSRVSGGDCMGVIFVSFVSGKVEWI